MEHMKKLLYLITGGIGALVIAAAALFVYTHAASAAQGSTSQPAANSVNTFALPQVSAPEHGGGPGIGGDAYDEALAEALGITVDELQAAYTEANTAAINQAVADGLLTQEQADAILSGDHPEGHKFGFHGLSTDYNTYLADALGITVDALEAAEQEARSAVIAQAVTDGKITQDQADLMLAQSALQPYLQEAMTAAFEEALQKAVAEGAITQEQADLLRENATSKPGGFGFGFDGPHGGHGHHGFGPGAPDGDNVPPTETSPTDDSNNS